MCCKKSFNALPKIYTILWERPAMALAVVLNPFDLAIGAADGVVQKGSF